MTPPPAPAASVGKRPDHAQRNAQIVQMRLAGAAYEDIAFSVRLSSARVEQICQAAARKRKDEFMARQLKLEFAR